MRAIGGHLPESLPGSTLDELATLLVRAGDDAITLGSTTARPSDSAGFAIRQITQAGEGAGLVVVDKTRQGPQEVAGSVFARILGMDHIVPLAVAQGDEGARIIFRPGDEIRKLGISSLDELVQLRSRRLEAVAPDLDAPTRLRVARTEMETMQAMDYLLANSDRHGGNVLVDAATGQVTFIDQAALGNGTLFLLAGSADSPLRPRLKPLLQGADGHTSLSADTVEWITSRLDEPTIRVWMRAHPTGTVRLREDEVVARFHELVARQGFDYSLPDTSYLRRNDTMSKYYSKFTAH